MSDDQEYWLVVRLDDPGNVFLVDDRLDSHTADALVATLTARGHKQAYSAYSYTGRAGREALLASLKIIE